MYFDFIVSGPPHYPVAHRAEGVKQGKLHAGSNYFSYTECLSVCTTENY
jgi:hypothetical protein